jgi:delta-aminolevulinic acid dehydratase/porphobilinogen synthase
MNRLLKMIRKMKALQDKIMSKGEKVSNSHAFVIERAGARDIDWYFADNVAEKRLKKSR